MILSDAELEKLTGYQINQRKRMCRWLKENGYPYRVNRLGEPVVLRRDVETLHDSASTPNFDWLRAS